MAKYDIALSYASEQRAYVEQVARILNENGLNVFYDCFKEVELWEGDLKKELWKVFSSSAYCVVIFISKEYKEKEYTQYEVSAILSSIMNNNGEMTNNRLILPIALDDSELQLGLKEKKYIDAKKLNPFELAELIIEKMKMKNFIISIDHIFEEIKDDVREICHQNLLKAFHNNPQLFSAAITVSEKLFYFSFEKCTVSGKGECIYLYDLNSVGIYGSHLYTAVISIDKEHNRFIIKNSGYFNDPKIYITIDYIGLKGMISNKFSIFLERDEITL